MQRRIIHARDPDGNRRSVARIACGSGQDPKKSYPSIEGENHCTGTTLELVRDTINSRGIHSDFGFDVSGQRFRRG